MNALELERATASAAATPEVRKIAEAFTVEVLNTRHRDVVEPLTRLLERVIQEAAAGAFASAKAEIEAARARATNAEYNATTWEVAAYATREALTTAKATIEAMSRGVATLATPKFPGESS